MRAEVRRYYGEVLKSSADLKTTACRTDDKPPDHVKSVLAEIHDDVVRRCHGCGLVLPEALEGARILDPGCGAGRDVYVLSRLVGPSGRVVGIDMTHEQLEVARRDRDFLAEQFGYSRLNVHCIDGDIEHLEDAGLDDGAFDIIVSNCVINLLPTSRRCSIKPGACSSRAGNSTSPTLCRPPRPRGAANGSDTVR